MLVILVKMLRRQFDMGIWGFGGWVQRRDTSFWANDVKRQFKAMRFDDSCMGRNADGGKILDGGKR